MTEVLGDIRETANPSLALAHESLRALGYVVVSDTASVGLDQEFRTDCLPAYTDFLESDIVPPYSRRVARALVDYEVGAGGGVQLTRDYPEVAIPPRSYYPKPRFYNGGLRVLQDPVFSNWLKGAIGLALPGIDTRGSVRLNYIETGSDGKQAEQVVEKPHQDDEKLVGSFVEFFDGEGAVTSLYRPKDDSGDRKRSNLEEVTSFQLGVGDLTLSDDVGLSHYVSPVLGHRRALILVFNKPETHLWLQQYYAER